MVLLQEMLYLYNENTTGTLAVVLVVTVIVYFIFFGKISIFDIYNLETRNPLFLTHYINR